jgi:hypothetical protein
MYFSPKQKTQPLAGFLFFYQDETLLHGNPARNFNSGTAQVAETVGSSWSHRAYEFTE